MRLWHQQLIHHLDRQRLLGQHRECCALRGKGWGRKHATVDYAFNYPMEALIAYHRLVMREMVSRGYHPDPKWLNPSYRGEAMGLDAAISTDLVVDMFWAARDHDILLYKEHNEDYFNECVRLLEEKKAEVNLAGVYWNNNKFYSKERTEVIKNEN